MKDDSSKVLLVGPSYKIADYGIDYFKNKRREGYKIVSYTGSILYFREIGFAPDYFSWIDPTSVLSQSWNAITDSGDFFKNTDMLTANLFHDNAAAYKKHRLITTTSMNKENCRRITEELPKFFNKCHWHKVRLINSIVKASRVKELREKYEHLFKVRPRKARELIKKIRRMEASRFDDYGPDGKLDSIVPTGTEIHSTQIPNFKQHLYFIRCDKLSGHVSISVDKLTSFVLPLVLHHFGDSLGEIRILGFGDFEEEEMGINVGRWEPESFKTKEAPIKPIPHSEKSIKRQKELLAMVQSAAIRQEERTRTISSFRFLFGHYYLDYLQKEKIKLSFENENYYFRIAEGQR